MTAGARTIDQFGNMNRNTRLQQDTSLNTLKKLKRKVYFFDRIEYVEKNPLIEKIERKVEE